jgi:hypothetical protein
LIEPAPLYSIAVHPPHSRSEVAVENSQELALQGRLNRTE